MQNEKRKYCISSTRATTYPLERASVRPRECPCVLDSVRERRATACVRCPAASSVAPSTVSVRAMAMSVRAMTACVRRRRACVGVPCGDPSKNRRRSRTTAHDFRVDRRCPRRPRRRPWGSVRPLERLWVLWSVCGSSGALFECKFQLI